MTALIHKPYWHGWRIWGVQPRRADFHVLDRHGLSADGARGRCDRPIWRRFCATWPFTIFLVWLTQSLARAYRVTNNKAGLALVGTQLLITLPLVILVLGVTDGTGVATPTAASLVAPQSQRIHPPGMGEEAGV